MRILSKLGRELLFLDGGMGTMLQRHMPPGGHPEVLSVTRPDLVRDIHRAYIAAGCEIISANTFGANAPKLDGSGYGTATVVESALLRVREAIEREGAGDRCIAALDIGPTGRLLKPLGDLSFEQAVSFFAEAVSAGVRAGAKLILIETMTDSYELKAAMLAAKEYSNLPVFATVAPNAAGALLTGGDLPSAAALLEGLGADAIGINCGFGPAEMLPFLRSLCSVSSLPVVFTPNAGIPREQDGQTVFDLSPEAFAAAMREAVPAGASVLGGCCGTTPAHMKRMIESCRGLSSVPVSGKNLTVVSNYSHAVLFSENTVRIGERINPTGKPKLKEALVSRDYDYVVHLGYSQQRSGADILDVNVGLPELQEEDALKKTVETLQNAVDLPLQIDTANPAAMEAALRIYNGKALINSVSGKPESMAAVFPLLKKYGGVAVALTLDENGIPETPEGRLRVAEKILLEAERYGIGKKDLLFDPLTMAVSAGRQNAAVTLQALALIRQSLGVKTILGVSNVSFGLPARPALGAAMLSLAMFAGLDAAILDPGNKEMTDAYVSTSALLGRDPQLKRYIARFSLPKDTPASAKLPEMTLREAIEAGLKQEARRLAETAVETDDPLAVIERSIVPALGAVGEGFEGGTVFLPQLLMSAEAAKAAFEVVNRRLPAAESGKKGPVIVATVQGDIHDIGKNIAKALLENYRYRVIDLGRDVPPQAVLDAVRENGARLVGLSALMTTTVASMRETIALLKKETPGCRIMAGGAVLNEPYALSIGADAYVGDAMASVRFADRVFSEAL